MDPPPERVINDSATAKSARICVYLWAQWVDGAYWRRHGMEAPDPPTALVERIGALAQPELAPWRTVRDGLDVRGPYVEPEARTGDYKAVPSTPDRPAHTVTTWEDSVALVTAPGGARRVMTVREAMTIQTFPPEWRLAGRSKRLLQVGNAVPPDMAEVVMRALARLLR